LHWGIKAKHGDPPQKAKLSPTVTPVVKMTGTCQQDALPADFHAACSMLGFASASARYTDR